MTIQKQSNNRPPIEILHGDCRKLIPTIPVSSIDLVVTSPPYNVDLGNNKYNKKSYHSYDDKMPHVSYIQWLRGIFESLTPRLKNGARVALNIGDGKNGAIPTTAHLTVELEKIGYSAFSHIVWDKGQTSNRAAWGTYLSPAHPSFPTPFEHILIFSWQSPSIGRGETDLTREEFIEFSYAIWRFPGETKNDGPCPAPFPEELPYRLIKMLSWRGAMVFDPFGGNGTTAVVAARLGRKCISCDIDLASVKYAQKRYANFISSSQEGAGN